MHRCGRKRTGRPDQARLPNCYAGNGSAVNHADSRFITVLRSLILIFACLCLLSSCAVCEEQAIISALDLDELNSYAHEHSFDLSQWMISLISGDGNPPEQFRELMKSAIHQSLARVQNLAAGIALPVSALIILKLVLPSESSIRSIAALVCRIGCIPALSSAFLTAQMHAIQLMQYISKASEFLSPALIAAVALSGAETTSTFLSPMTGVCAQLIQGFLTKWGIALCTAAAGLAIAGSMSSSIRLNRLHNLLRRTIHWSSATLLSAFMAMLSIQGRLGAGRDNAATRTARYTIENIIPVIGSNVSDSLDSLLSTAHIVKNALGVSGIALIVSISIVPIAGIFLTLLALRLIEAVSEPLCDDRFSCLAAQFADSVEMLMIISISAALLCCLLTGSCMSAAANIVR